MYMKSFKKNSIYFILPFLLFLLPSIVHAQPADIDANNSGVPLDGGFTLLIAAGIGYAAKKLSGKKANKIALTSIKN